MAKTMGWKDVAGAMGLPADKKGIARAQQRLSFLGFRTTCDRCLGSGQYSYNPADGTRCFGCRGAGTVLKALTKPQLDKALKMIEDGALAPYFERAAKAAALRARVREIRPAIDSEWKTGAVHTAYRIAYKNRDIPKELLDFAKRINFVWNRVNEIDIYAQPHNIDVETIASYYEAGLALIREINTECEAWLKGRE